MLQLYNIELRSASKRFDKQDKKFIRVSYKDHINSIKKPSVYINEAAIGWNGVVKIPQIYGADMDFQVYEKEFWNNPQKIPALLYGTINLSENQKMGKWSVYSSKQGQTKVGYLTVDIRAADTADNNKSTGNTNKVGENFTYLTSILARKLPKLQAGKFRISYRQNRIETKLVTAIANQIHITDSIKLKDIKNTDRITFEVYENQIFICKGAILYKMCRNSNHIDLFDDSQQLAGQLYFQLSDQPNSSKKQLGSTERQHTQKFHPRNQSQPNLRTKIGQISLSRFMKKGKKNRMWGTANRKMSVVNSNCNIFAPTEKRFMSYNDKQTDIISYSQIPNMRFLEKHSNKYYKGASFGKGDKSDFTQITRQNPGVGDYKLPSIFDRY